MTAVIINITSTFQAAKWRQEGKAERLTQLCERTISKSHTLSVLLIFSWSELDNLTLQPQNIRKYRFLSGYSCHLNGIRVQLLTSKGRMSVGEVTSNLCSSTRKEIRQIKY